MRIPRASRSASGEFGDARARDSPNFERAGARNHANSHDASAGSLANLGGTGRAGGEDLRAGCRPPPDPPASSGLRCCGSNYARGGFDTRFAYLPASSSRVRENRLSTPTGREKSKGSSRCKPAARARWPRPASGQPASRARGRAEARASLRRQPAGRRWFVRACGGTARSRREWVRQRCKGNESCSRVRRCARARSRHRDVTRRAQRPSRVRLRRRTTFDEQDPVLRLNAGQNRRRAKGRSSRSAPVSPKLRAADSNETDVIFSKSFPNLFQIILHH